ncbi:MAG: C39 family peptidase [Sporolactobacillus sp.]
MTLHLKMLPLVLAAFIYNGFYFGPISISGQIPAAKVVSGRFVHHHAKHKGEKQKKEKQSSAQQQQLPVAKELSAPFVSQLPELPNGCEISSLTMLLQSAGVQVDKMTLASAIPKVPFQSGAIMGNPNDGFVGNMYHGNSDNPGLGVYHGPVAALARTYLGNRVLDLSGGSWDQVEACIAAGEPVWVITDVDFQPLSPSDWQPWQTQEGVIQVSFMEHSVLVTGYDQNRVYFNNPLLSQPGSSAPKAAFISAWQQFGSQAISYTAK